MNGPLAGLVIFIMVMEPVGRVRGSQIASVSTWIGLGLICVAAFKKLAPPECYLRFTSLMISVIDLLFRPDPLLAVRQGLEQASFLMVFIMLLGLLHEVAATSASTATSGAHLTRQPRGRRYYALDAGTAILAALFNLGLPAFQPH